MERLLEYTYFMGKNKSQNNIHNIFKFMFKKIKAHICLWVHRKKVWENTKKTSVWREKAGKEEKMGWIKRYAFFSLAKYVFWYPLSKHELLS